MQKQRRKVNEREVQHTLELFLRVESRKEFGSWIEIEKELLCIFDERKRKKNSGAEHGLLEEEDELGTG